MEINITVWQLDNMKHSIGYEHYSPHLKRGKYHAWRNYYCTPPHDDNGWVDLVEKGYAEQFATNYYRVSAVGISLLEQVLGIKITD